jgi:hypothetical protein
MNLFLLRLILTPSLVGAASLAGRRWGHSISGWIVALPLTSGPITFLLALTHGTSFAAHAAVGILAGGFSLAAFVLVYGRLAPSWPWLPTLAVSTLVFGLMTFLLQAIDLPVGLLWAAVTVSFALVLWLLPPDSDPTAPAEGLPGTWDIPLRMIIATTFVVVITGLAPILGPHLTGLLTPFPLFASTLSAFAQHQQGPAAAIKVLRGLMLGLFSFAGFMLALALMLEPTGIAGAFGIAIVVLFVLQGAALWLLQRRNG